jgi:hypothetical protein
LLQEFKHYKYIADAGFQIWRRLRVRSSVFPSLPERVVRVIA